MTIEEGREGLFFESEHFLCVKSGSVNGKPSFTLLSKEDEEIGVICYVNDTEGYVCQTGHHEILHTEEMDKLLDKIESEDGECVCDENNQVTISKDQKVPCPHCSDESEGYDEPRPEDERYFSLVDVKDYAAKWITHCEQTMRDQSRQINALKTELQDVREERDELRKLINSAMDDDIDTVFDERDNLQERVEEARDYVKNSDRSQIAPTANTDLLEILSEDSDEGENE